MATICRLRTATAQRLALGEDFTPEIKDAWAAAYGILASAMIEAQTTTPA